MSPAPVDPPADRASDIVKTLCRVCILLGVGGVIVAAVLGL
jgi:hypothetical protein